MRVLGALILWVFYGSIFVGILGNDDIAGYVGMILATLATIFTISKMSAFGKERMESIQKARQDAMIAFKERLTEGGFNIRFCDISPPQNTVIALDDTSKKIALGSFDAMTGTITEKIINISEILSMELIENGKSLFQGEGSELSGTLKSAAIGGLMFGGAGAVVATLASKGRPTVGDINLVFQTSDLEAPYLSFSFLGGASVGKGSPEYVRMLNTAKTWFARINAVTAARKKETAQLVNH